MKTFRVNKDTNYSAKYRMKKFAEEKKYSSMERSKTNTEAFRRKPYDRTGRADSQNVESRIQGKRNLPKARSDNRTSEVQATTDS